MEFNVPFQHKYGYNRDYVTLVYCGQVAGGMRISLGTEAGLSPGDTVLNGDPAHPYGKEDSKPKDGRR